MENQLEGQDTALYSMPDGKVPGGSLAGYRKAKPALSVTRTCICRSRFTCYSASAGRLVAVAEGSSQPPLPARLPHTVSSRTAEDGANRALARKSQHMYAIKRGKK